MSTISAKIIEAFDQIDVTQPSKTKCYLHVENDKLIVTHNRRERSNLHDIFQFVSQHADRLSESQKRKVFEKCEQMMESASHSRSIRAFFGGVTKATKEFYHVKEVLIGIHTSTRSEEQSLIKNVKNCIAHDAFVSTGKPSEEMPLKAVAKKNTKVLRIAVGKQVEFVLGKNRELTIKEITVDKGRKLEKVLVFSEKGKKELTDQLFPDLAELDKVLEKAVLRKLQDLAKQKKLTKEQLPQEILFTWNNRTWKALCTTWDKRFGGEHYSHFRVVQMANQKGSDGLQHPSPQESVPTAYHLASVHFSGPSLELLKRSNALPQPAEFIENIGLDIAMPTSSPVEYHFSTTRHPK